MRSIIVMFLLLAAGAIGVSRYMDRVASKPASTQAMDAMARAAPEPAPRQQGNGRTVTLQSDSRGHFEVDARIDGRRIELMVDSGASFVALREADAARLGIFPKPSDYTGKTYTANGIGKFAPVRLSRVEVNGITVFDVPAGVLPNDALKTNLLGMSFLSRIKWTHDRGRLVMEQ